VPVSVVTPVPACVREPLPVIAPAKETTSLRLKTSPALLVMLPATLPAVPPSPICRVPALIVVPPVVGAVRCQRGAARTHLVDRSAATDRAGKGDGVRAVEGQDSVVDHIARDRTGGAATSQLQGTSSNRRAARVGVVGSQRRGAWAQLRHRAASDDAAIERQAIGAVEDKSSVIEHEARDRAGGTTSTELQCTRRDLRAPRIRVCCRLKVRVPAPMCPTTPEPLMTPG